LIAWKVPKLGVLCDNAQVEFTNESANFVLVSFNQIKMASSANFTRVLAQRTNFGTFHAIKCLEINV
jgi:hypothetical protein